jgi:hypothetical protein
MQTQGTEADVRGAGAKVHGHGHGHGHGIFILATHPEEI